MAQRTESKTESPLPADSTPVTKDADGTPLPNLSAMNGSSHHKDIYFQMDAMQTTPSKTYGTR